MTKKGTKAPAPKPLAQTPTPAPIRATVYGSKTALVAIR